jgi:hypothetical protein
MGGSNLAKSSSLRKFFFASTFPAHLPKTIGCEMSVRNSALRSQKLFLLENLEIAYC